MMKRIIICMVSALICLGLDAQTHISKPDLSIPSKVAPAYFGPNAFPVPDMLDGTVSSELSAELRYDSFFCTMTDNLTDDVTQDVSVKLTLPLFSPRANLVIWMPVVEHFRTTPEVCALRRLSPGAPLSGMDSGDVYVSTDISLMEQEQSGYDIAIRAALKTASGNSFSTARVYDAPGYFFDLSAGRDICRFPDGALRVAVSSGFLCWQTDNGRQNDAVMYGMMTSFIKGRLSADVTLGGYVGWEGDGDRPMTLKSHVSWSFRNFALHLAHQAGFKDWPYHQIRFGISYSAPLR